MLKYGWMLAQHSIARMLQGGGRSQMDLKRRTCIYLRLPACLLACLACLSAWYFRLLYIHCIATVTAAVYLSDSRHLKYERDASTHDDECVHQVPDITQVGPGVRDHAEVDYLRDSDIAPGTIPVSCKIRTELPSSHK